MYKPPYQLQSQYAEQPHNILKDISKLLRGTSFLFAQTLSKQPEKKSKSNKKNTHNKNNREKCLYTIHNTNMSYMKGAQSVKYKM